MKNTHKKSIRQEKEEEGKGEGRNKDDNDAPRRHDIQQPKNKTKTEHEEFIKKREK